MEEGSFGSQPAMGERTENTETAQAFTLNSTVGEVESDPAFGDFGRLLFPVDRSVSDSMTLQEVSSSSVYVWYSEIHPDETVEILNRLKADADQGRQIFYPIYSDDEIDKDREKADTGLFFFRGNQGEKFAVTNAGGGFMYVGAMHDSFPHALELSERGYNAFALIYRPDTAYEDLARALEFIHDHAEELQVDPDGYSLWGGSAGARMAAALGNADSLRLLTGRSDIPQAAAVITQYTGYSSVSRTDAPTYANVGTRDGIADWRGMQFRLESLERLGIPTEFHVYQGLSHGFGIGTDTVAEGWVDDAVAFWEEQAAV
jgi:acetyl esterase/lipase